MLLLVFLFIADGNLSKTRKWHSCAITVIRGYSCGIRVLKKKDRCRNQNELADAGVYFGRISTRRKTEE
jgi:hypothetical protein